MRKARHRFHGRYAVQIQRAFGLVECAERVLEYRREKLFLAAEVVIEHALVRLCAPRDLIDARSEEPSICELLRGRQQDTATRAFRISFDFWLVHGLKMLREPRYPGRCRTSPRHASAAVNWSALAGAPRRSWGLSCKAF
jgi:hypothetical protein